MSNSGSDGSPRRRFLALVGVSAFAGCTLPGGAPQQGTDTSTPTRTPDGPRLLGYDVSTEHDPADWDGFDPDWTAPDTSPLEGDLTTERLVENLEIPWDLSFGTDGTLFITERVGRVLQFEDGDVRTVAKPADAIDAGSVEPGAEEGSWWVDGGEGGTLGVAAHPEYPDPPLVYVYYTYESDGEPRNKVEYFDVSAASPNRNRGTLVDDIPGNKFHNGGRLRFGPENYLWITTGDGGEGGRAQDGSSLGGKVLRVTPEGAPAPGNPDLGDDADPRIFSYGHRNPQGLVWLPDGTPVISEHGPTGRDEINRLVVGGNYGWPDTRNRAAYLDDTDVHRPLANTGKSDAWAPTGSVFYTGDAVSSLAGRMLVGGLRSQQLVVATITPSGADLPPAEAGTRYDHDWTDDQYATTTHTTFENELGRIRHVAQGPDGGLYATTSNRDGRAGDGFPTEQDDGLVRIVPDE